MRINKLALTNFRSYNQLDIEFEPGVTTFIGDNGWKNQHRRITYLSSFSIFTPRLK